MEIPYCELNAGKFGYSTRVMNPPPAEAKRNVIQFSLTEGCSHSACTFCDMYHKNEYQVKSLSEFKQHVNSVLGSFSFSKSILKQISRVFVGAGNALSVDTEILKQATQYALLKTKNATGRIPTRLAIYGNTKDIIKQGAEGLKYLRCGGTCFGSCSKEFLGDRRGVEVVYWGLESGNSEVLKMAGKGYNKEDITKAFDCLFQSSMRTSIMIIPGLGGIKYFDQHIKDTVGVLNDNLANIQWITFMGLEIGENTPYARIIEKECEKGKNRNLTPAEIVEQTARIIELLNFNSTIGIHGKDVHPKGYNPIAIGTYEINYNSSAQQLANQLRTEAKKKLLLKQSKLEKILD